VRLDLGYEFSGPAGNLKITKRGSDDERGRGPSKQGRVL